MNAKSSKKILRETQESESLKKKLKDLRLSVLDSQGETRTLWLLELLTEPKTYFVLSPSI